MPGVVCQGPQMEQLTPMLKVLASQVVSKMDLED